MGNNFRMNTDKYWNLIMKIFSKYFIRLWIENGFGAWNEIKIKRDIYHYEINVGDLTRRKSVNNYSKKRDIFSNMNRILMIYSQIANVGLVYKKKCKKKNVLHESYRHIALILEL